MIPKQLYNRIDPSIHLLISEWVNNNCTVIIKEDRRSKLGDYQYNLQKGHIITINAGLNDYSFIITLVHEIAHYHAFEQFGNRIRPHGKEWKTIYSNLLFKIIDKDVFPIELRHIVKQHALKPKASSYADLPLRKALMVYDVSFDPSFDVLEELQVGDYFELDKNRIFQIITKRRTRFLCELQTSKKRYLVNKMVRVKKRSK